MLIATRANAAAARAHAQIMRILMREFDKKRAFMPLVSVSQIKQHYFYVRSAGTIEWTRKRKRDVLRGLPVETLTRVYTGLHIVDFLQAKVSILQ